MIPGISVEIDHIPEPADEINEIIPKLIACPLCPAAGQIALLPAYPDEQSRQFQQFLSFGRSTPGIGAVTFIGDQPSIIGQRPFAWCKTRGPNALIRG